MYMLASKHKGGALAYLFINVLSVGECIVDANHCTYVNVYSHSVVCGKATKTVPCLQYQKTQN